MPLAGELPPGPGDMLLGEVGGAPLYIDAEQDRAGAAPRSSSTSLPGAATGFSLEGAEDVHFVTRVAMTPPLPPTAA